jgi:hypothetical protein
MSSFAPDLVSTMINFAAYAFLSSIVLFGTVIQTYIHQEYFYPTLVSLSQDKVPLAVIYNFILMLVIVIIRLFVWSFVGRLTPVETEQLMENGRSMIADTILFLIFYSPTINGKDVHTSSLIQFIGVIMVLKLFHSIVQIRVSRMFEIGIPSNLSIFRVGSLLISLLSVDLAMVHSISQLLDESSTFYTWLLFEFINVSISSLSTSLKFMFNLIDLRISQNGWQSKSVYIFYTELISDILQMTLYILFMGLFFYQNPTRLPIYAVADVLQVSRQLANRLRSFKKYREITRDMDKRFPNATDEDIVNAESCIICRDKLTTTSKVLRCGHIFHTECLKNWAVVQQTCPTCRADLLPRDVAPRMVTTTEAQVNSGAVSQPAVTENNIEMSNMSPGPADIRIEPAGTTNHNPNDLLVAIHHAREMVSFYEKQAEFWSKESKAIQAQLLPPREPEAFMRLVEDFRKDIESRQTSRLPSPSPADKPLSNSPSESSMDRAESSRDWDDVRRARQRKYEDGIRQKPSE